MVEEEDFEGGVDLYDVDVADVVRDDTDELLGAGQAGGVEAGGRVRGFGMIDQQLYTPWLKSAIRCSGAPALCPLTMIDAPLTRMERIDWMPAYEQRAWLSWSGRTQKKVANFETIRSIASPPLKPMVS